MHSAERIRLGYSWRVQHFMNSSAFLANPKPNMAARGHLRIGDLLQTSAERKLARIMRTTRRSVPLSDAAVGYTDNVGRLWAMRPATHVRTLGLHMQQPLLRSRGLCLLFLYAL